MNPTDLRPGQRIRVLQQIDRREGNWSVAVEGTVQRVEAEKTGSWFAHGKDDRLWLYRIRLEKPSGEMTTVSVDQHTRLEVLSESGVSS